jgi:hypothetical protein
MRTVRSYLAIAAPLTAVFAVGLCGVHTSSAPAGFAASMTAASAVRTDGDGGRGGSDTTPDEDDSGWGRSATAPGDNGDSGWG